MRIRDLTSTGLVALVLCLAASQPTDAAADSTVTDCDTRTVPVHAVGGERTISGTYCRPAGETPRAAFVLVAGMANNRAYWDFPYRPETYSFARRMADDGYASFAIDRLGTGESSKPPSALVTTSAQASAVHQVIGFMRDTGFDGTGFDRVLLGGHSLGSLVAAIEAGTYRDPDAVVITGAAHRFNPVVAAEILGVHAYPALLDPAFAGTGLDLGYLTTKPDHRYAAFHSPGEVDPDVLATDEETKDVLGVAEVPDAAALYLAVPTTSRIDAPVLIVMGEKDELFCQPTIATDCSTPARLLAQERPTYASAPCVDAVVMPGVGHDINLHPSAPQYQSAVREWAGSVTSGGCPGGS